MIPDWQIPCYERLRNEIVRSAVTDYKKALKVSQGEGEKFDREKALERWFRSKWGQFLCENQGEYIMEVCKKSKPKGFGRGRTPNITDEQKGQIVKALKEGEPILSLAEKYGVGHKRIREIRDTYI